MTTVALHQLSIGYTQKGRQRIVADHLDTSLRGGELTCLLGRNGIGKSTLLRTLSAFQRPLAGQVMMDDTPLDVLSDQQRSQLIGVVLTERPDVQNMTARDMVALGRSPYTGFWGTMHADDHEVVAEAIRLVGIEPLADRLLSTMSDGERQKVMIAKALAQQTPVIYLDEPTAFLDFQSKVELMQLLSRLAREQQKTILLSTHDVALSLQLADRLWLLLPSGLAEGTPAELARQGLLADFLSHPGVTFDPQSLTISVHS